MKKILVLTLSLLLFSGCSTTKQDKNIEEQAKNSSKDDIAEVSFSAVGDNLIHNSIYMYNAIGNDKYNFNDIYEHTIYLTQDADISYINQETICGGVELGLSSYPSFNGPVEVLDGVNSAGFNWIAASSNHTMDAGEQGIINQINNVKNNYSDTIITGSHRSQEEADQSQVIEKNGVRVGVLGYTYGLNGYVKPEGKDYLVDVIDKEKMKADLTKLDKVSDIIVVSMHWGDEYSFTVNDELRDLSQYLSDLGVDVIIGEHPHVIQPMDYVFGKDGNKTLVIYSLGNFLSAQDEADRMLGGMARFKIQYNKSNKEVEIKDVKFLPTITYIRGNMEFYRTYALKDYTNDIANTHMLNTNYGQDVSREYYINKVNEVMNDQVEIVY